MAKRGLEPHSTMTTVADDVWSPLDFDHEAYRVGRGEGDFKRFARSGVRSLHAAAGGSGTSDTVRLDDDGLLTVLNCVMPQSSVWSYRADETLIMLRASLSCDVSFHLDDAEPLVFNRPEVTLACLPRCRLQTVDIAGGVRQQGMVAVFRGATFARRYGLRPEDLPPMVQEAISGPQRAGRIASIPLDHRIAALIADTIDTRLEGEMKVLQYVGRLAELVAYALDAMRLTPSPRGTTMQLRRDMDLARMAMTELERDYRRPPLFAELAREIGTNQNKLKALFKEAYGLTMAQYCLERRMREAQQLLLEAALTIAQVAERVGYEHQSSFTAAFRSHVGMSPREYRQHRAPFSVPLDARPLR